MGDAIEFSVFVAVVLCLGFVLGRLSARFGHGPPPSTGPPPGVNDSPTAAVAASPPPSTGPPPSTSPTVPGVITLYSMIVKYKEVRRIELRTPPPHHAIANSTVK